MKLSDFNYNLPKELIAQEPINKRDYSRLMVLNSRGINNDHFYNIIKYLNKGDVLVINETKVLKNKLVGKKKTGAHIEIIIEKKIKDYYECNLRGHRVKLGAEIIFPHNLIGKVVKKTIKRFYIKFNKKNINKYLDKYGELPIPFYVKKHIKQQNRYQTIFAKNKGSFAAPTASLHFTKQLLKTIQNKGIKIAKITLHISFGTFLPIKEKDFTKHKMHEEYYEISEQASDIINNCKGRLICCGTTTVRTLESAAKSNGKIKPQKSNTDLFIYPGYKFKTPIKAMITNFHLPKSSLLLLVCGFYGKYKIFRAYKEAIKKKYRFYSFGDAMLLVK